MQSYDNKLWVQSAVNALPKFIISGEPSHHRPSAPSWQQTEPGMTRPRSGTSGQHRLATLADPLTDCFSRYVTKTTFLRNIKA